MSDLNLHSKLDRASVVAIVVAGVNEALADTPAEVTEETYLIGQAAVLDSMGLVTAILEIEQRLADEHEVTVVLADERAMSQKNSPFRSVRSLSDYVLQQINA